MRTPGLKGPWVRNLSCIHTVKLLSCDSAVFQKRPNGGVNFPVGLKVRVQPDETLDSRNGGAEKRAREMSSNMIFKALFGRKSEDKEPESLDFGSDFPEERDGEDSSFSEEPAESLYEKESEEESEEDLSEDDKILGEMNVRARAYEIYNRRKIKTIEERLHGLDRDIFRILPALVHLNTKGLPGFIEERKRVQHEHLCPLVRCALRERAPPSAVD